MKKFTYIMLLVLFFVGACKQEVLDLKQPETPPPPPTPSEGNADLSDPVFIGSSYMAGFQAGALFDDGQETSLAAILNNTLTAAGLAAGPADFQPSINSSLGYNIFVSPNPGTDNLVRGRFLLQGADPKPTAQPYALGDLSAVPNPSVNPGFMYSGTKANLRNFSVEAIMLGQFLIPNTGNWADPNPAHGFSPFYGRFASSPGTSTIIGDAIAANGSFVFLWVGMDDFMLYAAYGGDYKAAPLNNNTAFDGQYGALINALITTNPLNSNLQGVIGNYPDIFVMPHFTAVPYNPIPLDAATAAELNTNLSDNYNAFLDGMVALTVITQSEADKRYVHYEESEGNPALITDSDLTNLAPYMAGPYAGLLPYARARQTTAADILPLSAGSVLGVEVAPDVINGVTLPLADRYCIVPSEKDSINNRRTHFNETIATLATSSAGKLVLADVEASMAALVTNQAMVLNGVTITPNINPPSGIYSEDGLHPNSRGYAYISHAFIEAINTGFDAVVPLSNLALYQATGLPIP